MSEYCLNLTLVMNISRCLTSFYVLVRTETKQESLKGSLLSYMGDSPSENDLREAFCRDIDAYRY